MSSPSPARAELFAALVDLDEVRAVRLLDEHREREGLSSLVGDLVLPVMKAVGDGWECGEVSVAQEHLATQLVRSYLDALRRPPSVGGPQVWLACPPRELHDLPLELFGAMLHARWWRVVSLGANSPMTAIAEAARFTDASAVVVAGVRRTAFEARIPSLTRLARSLPLFLAGEGTKHLGSPPPGSEVLPDDLVAAAEIVDAVGRATTTTGASVEVPDDEGSEPAVG